MSRYHIDEEELDSRLPLLGDPEGRPSREDGRAVATSPAMSIISTQSFEVKHILEPCARYATDREADTGADYSHIHIRPKPRPSDGGFLVRPPPPAYHRPEGSNPPPPHFHQQSFQGSLLSGNLQRFRSPPQTLSLEDVSNYEFSRRKSWSPPLLRQNVSAYHGGQKNARSCYSSNMVDWEPIPQGPVGTNPPVYPPSTGAPHGYWQGYQQSHQLQGRLQGRLQGHLENHGGGTTSTTGGGDTGESLPPRLAPVSGVPPEKVSRNLIRPIAFKPAYTRPPPPKVCPQCREDVSSCVCAGFSSSHITSLFASQNTSQFISQPLSADTLLPRPPSVRSVDQSSVHSASHGSHRSAGYGSEPVYLVDDSPGVNVDYSPPRKASAAGSEAGGPTPSPSDSGVGELEAMLKEREAEILTLRQVMDRNERAIFQVYEERRSQWLLDMQHIREDYERKLKAQQLKATQLEQALASQVQRLHKDKPPTTLPDKNHTPYTDKFHQEKTPGQQEKAHTPQEKGHTLKEKAVTPQDKGDAPQEEVPSRGNYANLQKEAAAGLEDSGQTSGADGVTWSLTSPPQNPASRSVQCSPGSAGGGGLMSVQEEMALKNTEILALREQLHTLQTRLEQRDDQLADTARQVQAKSDELKVMHEQLDQLSGVDGVSMCEGSSQTVVVNLDESSIERPAGMSDEEYTQSLERQMNALRQQLQTAEAVVESERMQWLEEKNKVIRYQKQLQLNYIQMQQKNKILEAEVEQLTMELESRHLKLAALNGEESVC
ncbi:hypothetical protein ACOMHN_062775 [Nucella lapillus]